MTPTTEPVAAEPAGGRPGAELVDLATLPATELLSFGPTPVRRSSRVALVVVGGVVAALLVVFAVWQLRPKPPTPFSLVDLQGVYAGMVRADGTNELSTLTRERLTEPPPTITPAACVPLFEATLSNQFPATAIDGVSTYWLNEGPATISLLTFRYADAAAARQQFSSVSTALRTCSDLDVRVNGGVVRHETPQLVGRPAGVQDYLSYVESHDDGDSRFSTDVALVDNTVSWQYRFDNSTPENYSPMAAQQLMTSLVMQMHSVQDAHS